MKIFLRGFGIFEQTQGAPNPSVDGVFAAHELSGAPISRGTVRIQNPFLRLVDHLVAFPLPFALLLSLLFLLRLHHLSFSVFFPTLLYPPSKSRRSRGGLSVRIRCRQAGCRNSGAIYSRLFLHVGERPMTFLNLCHGSGMAS
jgi:hypothetical protein